MRQLTQIRRRLPKRSNDRHAVQVAGHYTRASGNPYRGYRLYDHTEADPLKAYFGDGNAKIKNSLIWNLPAGDSCPGATPDCYRHCYARGGYAAAAEESRERNWVFAERDDFVDAMVFAFEVTGLKMARIHESGDFYSADYLQKWIRIAEALPGVRFFAYTRSWHLFAADVRLPANLVVRYSVDASTTDYPELDLPRAYMGAQIAPSGTLICPVDRYGKKAVQCNNGCLWCPASRKDVVFTLKLPGGNRKQKQGIPAVVP